MAEESLEQLVREGFTHIDRGEVHPAVRIGRRLVRRRHILGFEIIAMALDAVGKIAKAARVLEKAVTIKADVWRLWELLGNYRSDLELYEASKEAYRQALVCPDVNRSSIQYNLSVVLNRQGRYEEAMTALGEVADKSMSSLFKAQRLKILNNMERFEETMELGETYLREAIDDEETSAEATAYIGAEVALAFWHGAKDAEGALELALAAIRQNHVLPRALWLVREIESRISPANKYYRLTIDGDWPRPAKDGTLQGFIVVYDVVARSLKEGMEYVRRCEDPDMRDCLRIDEWKEIEPRPTDPAGVYKIGKYHLYPQGAK